MTRTYVPNDKTIGIRVKVKRDAPGEYTVLRQEGVGTKWVPIGSIWNNAGTDNGDWAYVGYDGASQGFTRMHYAIYWVVNEVA